MGAAFMQFPTRGCVISVPTFYATPVEACYIMFKMFNFVVRDIVGSGRARVVKYVFTSLDVSTRRMFCKRFSIMWLL